MQNYRVVTVEKPPFVMYDSEKKEWHGYCIELMTYLSGMLNFTYNIEATPDGQFGSIYDNGTWDGMIRELQDKRADIALGALSIMSERENVVDFTIPYYDAVGTIMMMKKKEVKTTFLLFITAYNIKLWLSLFGLYLVAFMFVWLFDRWSPFSYQNNRNKDWHVNDRRVFNLKETLWFTTITITPQGCGDGPTNFSGRLALLSWWIYAFIALAAYTINLAAYLTLSRLVTPLESLEDFTRQYRYKFATIKPSEAQTYYERMSHIEGRFYEAWVKVSLNTSLSEIEEAGFDIYQYPINNKYTKLLRVMNETGHPANLKDALHRVNTSRFALIGDATDIKYITRTHCDFMTVGEEFSKRPYGIAVQEGSPLKDQMDKAILQLSKSGILEKLKHRWWNEKIKIPKCPREYKIIDGMTIGDMGGIFVIVGVGICLAIGTLSFEFWWYRCWLPRKHCKRDKRGTNDRSGK